MFVAALGTCTLSSPTDAFAQEKQIKGARFFREISAGITTFATMAYIIAVNVRDT